MSIYGELLNRVNERRLTRLMPLFPRVGLPTRQIFVSNEIEELIEGPWHSPEWEERCNWLRGDLDRFTEGGLLAIASAPYKGKTSYLKRLDPADREVWSIRSRDPEPGIRMLGCFAKKDVFVALTWRERAPLLGPNSRGWRDAAVSARTEWNNLFPAYGPLSGGDFHDYISNIVLV